MTSEVIEDQIAISPPVAKEETPLARERITYQLGKINETRADAVVCPQDDQFNSRSIEAGLLRGTYGEEPFLEVKSLFQKRMQGLEPISKPRKFHLLRFEKPFGRL